MTCACASRTTPNNQETISACTLFSLLVPTLRVGTLSGLGACRVIHRTLMRNQVLLDELCEFIKTAMFSPARERRRAMTCRLEMEGISVRQLPWPKGIVFQDEASEVLE